MIVSLNKKDMVFDRRANGQWCKLPYPDHPKGCMNYNKKIGCPPKAKFFLDIVTNPFFLVTQKFDIAKHAQRMKKLHPNWTNRQARCVLYWQGSLRKKIREEAKEFIDSQNKDLMILEIPEANGVDIFKTCKNLGIILDRNPQKIIWKVMIIGKPLTERNSIENS